MKRLALSGGRAITPQGARVCDIVAEGGRIAAILPHNPRRGYPAGTEIVDARGKLVLPGIIDPHVHLRLPAGDGFSSDDFESGTKAAIASGVTTVIDYTAQPAGVALKTAVAQRRLEADGKVHCDYGLHCVIPSWKALENPEKQLRGLARSGVPTFKMFMIYEERGLQSDDGDMYAALAESARCGAMICVHAESGRILRYLLSIYKGRKELGAKAHALARPDFTEWEAVQRGLTWAGITGGNIYFVHLSAGRSAELVRKAAAAGVNAHGETCPQYLVLDDSVFDSRADGHLFATCPQVKKKTDSAALWRAVGAGGVSALATDHCPFTRAQKDRWAGDITRLLFGMPGVETLLPLVYTCGMKKGKISLQRLVQVMCENPARLMGLYPAKGALAVGADADLVLLDPRAARKVEHSRMQTNCDWNPYDGMRLYGWPEKVFLRGKLAAQGGVPVGKARGKFIKRGRPDLSVR
ncbi:MAG: amidohydrolase family protein [Elusimicrobiaceae bacterium]|nr:amidohydrolase family protein [Elusimicrobiaceae bacterium]